MVCLDEVIFPVALSVFSPCCHVQKIPTYCQLLCMAGIQNRAWVFSPQTEGCVWQHLWQKDGFRCADLTCLQHSGFAQAGPARACFVCTCERFPSSSLHTQEDQMPCCQFPLSCNLASPSFFFLTCALYHKPQLQCPQQLQGAAGLRWDRERGSAPCGCDTTWCFHRLQVVPCILSPMAPFPASLQPRVARTHAWEPLGSWDLKPLAHVITQTRVCWQLQPLPASLSGALGHNLLVLWLGYE